MNDIIDYCNTDKCLRKYILEYFGEIPLFNNCENCSNCLYDTELTDITIDSQKILSCIKRMHERFGSGLVTDVLKGSKSSKIRSMGFDKLSTYGIMSEYSKDTIKDLIYFLITEGYIQCIGDKYPILTLHPSANEVLLKNKQIFIKRKIEKISEKDTLTTNSYDTNLFNLLKDLRKKIAEKYFVPPFIVFSDASLKEMCTFYPQTKTDMLNINGVGLRKFESYGTDFLNIICNYVEQNNISAPILQTSTKTKNLQINASDKIDTKTITYNMYKKGKTITEIANIRGLTKQTVEHHLLNCFEAGMEIDLENHIQMQYKNQIFQAIDNLGFSKLKPLKEALPNNVTYFDIGYFVALYKLENSSNV